MAHTIDEVWQLCTDINTTLNDLHPIKVKLDSVEAKIDSMIAVEASDEIWQICYVCKGLGYHEVDVFSGAYPSTHTVEHQTCWLCNGTTRVKFGEQKPPA